MKINRLDDVPLLSTDEIIRRLQKIRKEGRGQHPEPGPGISLRCVQVATGLAWCTVYGALFGRTANGGRMTQRTQVAISVFFARYDAGEFSFTYCRKKYREKGGPGSWQIIYHTEPVSREVVCSEVTLTGDGPKLGFRMMNRTWV